MMFRALAFVLVIVACAHTLPAPSKPRITLIKNSSFGFGVAAGGATASGTVVEKDRSFEAPFPGNTGDNFPDVTILENVNTGAAFAFAGGITTGLNKNTFFTK